VLIITIYATIILKAFKEADKHAKSGTTFKLSEHGRKVEMIEFPHPISFAL
jgi:hypothetical protein